MSNVNTTSNSIAVSPKGYAILQCKLTTNKNTVVDLFQIVQDVKINESLYQSGIIVDIFILDALNLFNELNIAGNEKIRLTIGRQEPGNIKKFFDLNLNIAEIKDYSTPTPSSKAYTLQCVSKHIYLNNSKILKREFKNNASRLIKDIVTRDLSSKLKISNKNNSKDVINGIYPRISPLQAISWLLRNSFDNGTPFYFYETAKDGLVLNSYNQIRNDFKEKAYKEYNNYPFYKSSALDGKDGEAVFNEESKKIMKLVSQINLSKHAASLKGAFRAQLNTIDISTKTIDAANWKYEKSDGFTMNKYPPISDKMKIDDKGILKDFQDSKQYYVSLNSKAYDKQNESVLDDSGFYIIEGNNYHSPANNTILKAQAIQHNLDTIKQEIIIPGDFGLSSGMIIDLKLVKNADVTLEQIEQEEFTDKVLSGKHLVTGILHHFSKEGYTQNVILKKDSFLKEI